MDNCGVMRRGVTRAAAPRRNDEERLRRAGPAGSWGHPENAPVGRSSGRSERHANGVGNDVGYADRHTPGAAAEGAERASASGGSGGPVTHHFLCPLALSSPLLSFHGCSVSGSLEYQGKQAVPHQGVPPPRFIIVGVRPGLFALVRARLPGTGFSDVVRHPYPLRGSAAEGGLRQGVRVLLGFLIDGLCLMPAPPLLRRLLLPAGSPRPCCRRRSFGAAAMPPKALRRAAATAALQAFSGPSVGRCAPVDNSVSLGLLPALLA